MNVSKGAVAAGVLGSGSIATATVVATQYVSNKAEETEDTSPTQDSKIEKPKPVTVAITQSEITESLKGKSGSIADRIFQDWSPPMVGCYIRVKFTEEENAKRIIQLSNSEGTQKTDLESLYAALEKGSETESLCKQTGNNGNILEATKLETNKWIFKEGDRVEDDDHTFKTIEA